MIPLENFNIKISVIGLSIFIIFATLVYAAIFYKHHKRNKLNYVEIAEIYMKYIALFIISAMILIFAFDMFLTGLKAIEYRRERYTNFILAVLITGIDIWNFIRFVKLNLKDIKIEEREEEKKNTIKVGEVLQLIFFTIIMLTPIWRIPEFFKLLEDKKEMFIQIGISFFYSILAIFLLLKLNPLDIKNKLQK